MSSAVLRGFGRVAAVLAKDIYAQLVIPCHYEMFEFNTATPDEFVAECWRLVQPYRVLRAGERWSSEELRRRSAGNDPYAAPPEQGS